MKDEKTNATAVRMKAVGKTIAGAAEAKKNVKWASWLEGSQ